MEDSTPTVRRRLRTGCRGSSWRPPAASSCRPSCCCCPSGPGTATGWCRASRSSTSVTSTARPSTGPWPSWNGTVWWRRRPQNPTAGQARRVYRITALGRAGPAGLDGRDQGGARLPRRGPAPLPGHGDDRRRPGRGRGRLGDRLGLGLVAGVVHLGRAAPPGAGVNAGWRSDGAPRRPDGPAAPEPGNAGPGDSRADGRFRLVPDRSVVLIEVRSTVGPLSFGAIGITGSIEAACRDG